MDLDDFRSILETAGADVWMFIDTAIDVASIEYNNELKRRRDGIVQRLYEATSAPGVRCRNCEAIGLESNGQEISSPIDKQSTPELKRDASPVTPHSIGQDYDDLDPYGGLLDDEQKKIQEIKEQLEDPDQPEDYVVELLQILADMDITFQALKETDIGRHVNRLRKHPSNDVRRLVKLLVRKWKEIVDEWVKVNQPGDVASAVMANGDSSPMQKNAQNGHNQVPDFAYSPNPHYGSSGSERNYSEAEPKSKTVSQRAPPKPATPVPIPAPAPQNRKREQRDSNFEADRLASARRRLQENYKEAENAKRQRTIQVMDIHEIPRPKKAFFPKNKGGAGSQARHW